jgi:acetylornithine deacetylase
MIDITRLLADLVRLPSVNPMGRHLEGPEIYEHQVSAYLERFFQDLGVDCQRQSVASRRDNIVARCELDPARPTLLLEAHQDTIPTDNMTIDPFAAKVENGRLYGRGACDIKGGLAAMLWAFARVAAERPRSAMNVVLAATVDEEHGGLGVKHLVKSGCKADMAVVAEPTNLDIVHAHKGVIRWVLETRGRSCHSSAPEQGENAIYAMARVVEALEAFAADLRSRPADPVLGPPSLSVGLIQGGTSVNTVPDSCRIEIDRRLVGGEDPDGTRKTVEEYLKKALGQRLPLTITQSRPATPALVPKGADALVGKLGAAIDAVRGSHKVKAVPFATDASTIATAQVPVVVFGPGDIAMAHTRDEWVALDEVRQGAEILYRLAAGAE